VLEEFGFFGQCLVVVDSIDCVVVGGRDDLGGGIMRFVVLGLAFECDGECFLYCVFGEVEIVEDVDEDCDCMFLFFLKDVIDCFYVLVFVLCLMIG